MTRKWSSTNRHHHHHHLLLRRARLVPSKNVAPKQAAATTNTTFSSTCTVCQRRNPGAAEDGSVKVFIVARAIFNSSGGAKAPKRNSSARGDPDTSPPTPAFRLHVKDGHVKDAAQGVAEDVAQDLAFRARAARALLATPPPPPLPSLCSSQ